ncbi:hypothetical protein [Sandarakinorhabdus rubra]|uniref:hypothetical protein n=1 Tax=Sandarakinorhabdus rubra TaxID=2672568 RepID=UPI0013DD501D|nr:hypothetical protein [Sandarakinorhabdus rubra]
MSRIGFLDALVRSEPFRVFQIILGALLIPVAGIVGLVTPPGVGLIVAGAGVALVLRNSRWARRRYLFHTRRHPRVRKAVDLGLMRRRRRRRTVAAEPPASLTNPASDPTSPPMPQV